MPLFSSNSESMMSAFKSRFGYHQNHQPDVAETDPAPAKSFSTPDLFQKSASRGNLFLQSSSREDNSSKPDDCQATSGAVAVSRSFEFCEDPNFWKEHSVQVIIRLRPLSSSELSVQGHSRCVRQDSSQAITWTGPPESRFTFDLVADENVTQEMLFKVSGVSLVENCMEGYNSCMFAYGQTGSGKTHTMLGDIEGGARRHSVNCGMTPRVFEYLFSRIQKDKDARREEKLRFTCKCSFLEIYNEQILDLLDPSSANLQIREDNKKGIYVENITEVEVTSARDVIQQLIQGSANRKVAATNMNRASSRSHSVFTCIIESKWESQGVTHHRFARLNLVDLAGSERQKSSGAEGERLKEATNINKSLSTLGLVIMNLVSISNGKPVHVPYRDSKLTFLLQDSLGGNAKTIMIANISPSTGCSLETLGTLKFAQRAKFIKNHAIVNEDASGDVLALRLENQNLKKEVSHLRSLVNGGGGSHDADVSSSITFPGSPGSFKWEGQHGFSSPIISEKRTPFIRKKEFEVALVGVLRREKDNDMALQALVAENQAIMQLAKQREDEIQGLKMRLRFREAGIKRLEAVASGKIPAETHLLNERDEHLKEIEVLRAQVDRNQEVTRFAMENLQLKEEIRRLKSFCEEGERERLNEQIVILENKLLDALDWKLMHESDPANVKESSSMWQSTDEENEFLRMQAIQNQSEIDSLHKRLDFIVIENEKLERNVSDLTKELEAERLSKEAISEELQKRETNISSLATNGQSDQSEIKSMVDAISSASQREAEAHEMAVFLSNENEGLRTKLKVLIEDNNKLIDLYESAVSDNRTKTSDNSLCLTKAVEDKDLEMKGDIERLNSQLSEMHEENDKLLSLYEKAMQERDDLKKVIASGQPNDKEDIEIDGGRCLSFSDGHCSENDTEMEESDTTARNIEPDSETIKENLLVEEPNKEMSEDLKSIREKLFEAQEKLSHSAQTLCMFSSLEKATIEVDAVSEKIRKLEQSMQEKKQDRENLKSVSSEMRERRDLACKKLSALKYSLTSFSSSAHYFEQRETQARSRLDVSSYKLSKKREEMNGLELSRNEVVSAVCKAKEMENELRNNLERLSLKVEEENRKVESERVLFAIDNVEHEHRSWQVSGKATALLRSEEEKTKLQNGIKANKDKLREVRRESEVLSVKLRRIESEMKAVEEEMQKEVIIAGELNAKVESIGKEKEMILEVEENVRDEFEKMVVEYYEGLFEAELKEEEVRLVDEEVMMEMREIEGLEAAKDGALRRKKEMLDSLPSEMCSVSEKVEADVRSVRASVVELNALLGRQCGSMEF